jgi:hypothetical protein
MVLTGTIQFQWQVNWGSNLPFLSGDPLAVGFVRQGDISVHLLETNRISRGQGE